MLLENYDAGKWCFLSAIREHMLIINSIKKILPNYSEQLPLEDQLESLQIVSLVIEIETIFEIQIPALLARQIFTGTALQISEKLVPYCSEKTI